jgi:hypothetical protein
VGPTHRGRCDRCAMHPIEVSRLRSTADLSSGGRMVPPRAGRDEAGGAGYAGGGSPRSSSLPSARRSRSSISSGRADGLPPSSPRGVVDGGKKRYDAVGGGVRHPVPLQGAA